MIPKGMQAAILIAAWLLTAPSGAQSPASPDPATPVQETPAQNKPQNAPPAKSKHRNATRQQGPACEPLQQADLSPEAANATPADSPAPLVGQDVCIEAHVYDVVELADGTRFLDVCQPNVPDDRCRFTVISLAEDREQVGELRRYRDQNIQLRGTLRSLHGRMGIVLSHARQFNGGPEKFRPNPRLLRDFNAQSGQMPVRDPNLAPAGHHRSFMNTGERQALTQQKP